MADDTVELLRTLEVENADLFGYSMGGGIALQIALRNPDLVRKLVIAGTYANNDGAYPQILAMTKKMTPADFEGLPLKKTYASVAPHPEDWPALVTKVKQLDLIFEGWSTEEIKSIQAPVLLIIGDSDIVRPEHAIEMFRQLGGGVPGDLAGLPRSQLAVLPGTTHRTLINRTGWLPSMTTGFLDAPMPEAE